MSQPTSPPTSFPKVWKKQKVKWGTGSADFIRGCKLNVTLTSSFSSKLPFSECFEILVNLPSFFGYALHELLLEVIVTDFYYVFTMNCREESVCSINSKINVSDISLNQLKGLSKLSFNHWHVPSAWKATKPTGINKSWWRCFDVKFWK